MHWNRPLILCSLLTALCACPGGVDPKRPPKDSPRLSETPVWELEPDPAQSNGCFGRTVALGDINGDGRRDLAVGASPCLNTTREPGRVALFGGEAPYFSREGVWQTLDWQNTHPRTNGNNLQVSTGTVNRDGYADVLVSGTFGAMVFKGNADLGAVLTAPAFRVPGTGVFGTTQFMDVDGDGLDDVLSVRMGVLSFYRATPGAEAGPFTLVPRESAIPAGGARRVGDVNGDGAQDLLVFGDGVSLYLGCKAGGAIACDGALSTEPLWSMPFGEASLTALWPDLNGDGERERILDSGGGTVRLHLSDGQGGMSSTPVWTAMSDPAFPLFGWPFLPVGDMDGDGQGQDFVVAALGRLYFYSPAEGVSQALRPAWAWPRSDSLSSHFEGFQFFSVVAPGDLEGDGFADLVVGLAPPPGVWSELRGRVAIFGGGSVPAKPKQLPYLPEVESCGLELDAENGKPDLTVDADVLARTLYVERRTFAADACEVVEGCVPAAGDRRLLRFSTSILNLGSATATVPNSDERPDLYVLDACHRHEHLTNFAGYALRDSQGQDVVQGRKQGFYLVDFHRQCSDAAPASQDFEHMSISPGWADIYIADIPCQWIDITDLRDDVYTLRVGVDQQDIIEEEDVLPNEAVLRVRLLGDSVTVLP